MSDSVRPHRGHPTRLPPPWDSPGKSTGVGCHCLLQCMKMKSENEVAQPCPTQRPHVLQPTRLLCPWDFPGKSTGVGSHCLLQVCTSSQGITSITHSLVKYIQFHHVSIIERQKATLAANLSSIGQKRSNYPESTYNNQIFPNIDPSTRI